MCYTARLQCTDERQADARCRQQTFTLYFRIHMLESVDNDS